jgi:putative transposase
MGQIKRIRRGKAGWGKLFVKQAGSGLPVMEFCRQEGINAALFRRWHARLEGSSRDAQVILRKKPTRSPPFIDLGDLRAAAPRLEVRLDLGGGMVLGIARG